MARIDQPAFLEQRNADDLAALLADVYDSRIESRTTEPTRSELREDDRIRWFAEQVNVFGSGMVNLAPTGGAPARPTHIRPAVNDG
jgi:hypothetical protein